ncbi:hypothetical protein THAOC_27699, partial [Thalassiosira oceanica]
FNRYAEPLPSLSWSSLYFILLDSTAMPSHCLLYHGEDSQKNDRLTNQPRSLQLLDWCEPLGHSRHFSSAPSPPNLIQNKQPEFKNVLLHETASELVEGKSEAKGELLGLLISSKFIPVLVMMQGTSYPQLGHSLFQYNSSARNADENHRDVVLFVGDRTIRGDPTAFVIDMEAADTLGKLKEVEVGLGDEEIEEFLQDPSNDGQLLGQARSLGSKKKSTLVLLPINDNVAEFVATENPSMHDFDAWVNDADNHKVGDAEAAGINEWTHMAVLTNDNDKKKKKSSILAVDLQAITSPSVELSKCMAARLDTTLGRAPHPSPQARSSPVGDARLQRQIDAKKPKSTTISGSRAKMVTEDMAKMLMKGQFIPTGGDVPLMCNITKTCSHMACVPWTSRQLDDYAQQRRAGGSSTNTRTYDEAVKLEEKEITGKLARPPPSTYHEFRHVIEDQLIRMYALLTKHSPMVDQLEELHSFLNSFVAHGDTVPEESWLALSYRLYVDETQYFAEKASQDDIADNVNLPVCTLLKSNVLWELRYTKQIAQALDVLPAWKGQAKKDRPYNPKQRGTWGKTLSPRSGNIADVIRHSGSSTGGCYATPGKSSLRRLRHYGSPKGGCYATPGKSYVRRLCHSGLSTGGCDATPGRDKDSGANYVALGHGTQNLFGRDRAKPGQTLQGAIDLVRLPFDERKGTILNNFVKFMEVHARDGRGCAHLTQCSQPQPWDTNDAAHNIPEEATIIPFMGMCIGDYAKVRRTSGVWKVGRVIDIGTSAGGLPFIKFRFTISTKVLSAPYWDSHVRPLRNAANVSMRRPADLGPASCAPPTCVAMREADKLKVAGAEKPCDDATLQSSSYHEFMKRIDEMLQDTLKKVRMLTEALGERKAPCDDLAVLTAKPVEPSSCAILPSTPIKAPTMGNFGGGYQPDETEGYVYWAAFTDDLRAPRSDRGSRGFPSPKKGARGPPQRDKRHWANPSYRVALPIKDGEPPTYVWTEVLKSWGFHPQPAWYMYTSKDHYHAHMFLMKKTCTKRLSDTAALASKRITSPELTHADAIVNAASRLASTVQSLLGEQRPQHAGTTTAH